MHVSDRVRWAVWPYGQEGGRAGTLGDDDDGDEERSLSGLGSPHEHDAQHRFGLGHSHLQPLSFLLSGTFFTYFIIP